MQFKTLLDPTTPTRAIITIGLFAGVLDGLAACVQAYLVRGTSPAIVFQYIASAVLGKASFEGGLLTAAFGLLCHLTIATSWAALFFVFYPRVSLLQKSRILSAVSYALFVWGMMNLVVVPLTRIPARPFVLQNALIAALILVIMIGTPISFLTHRYYARMNSAA